MAAKALPSSVEDDLLASLLPTIKGLEFRDMLLLVEMLACSRKDAVGMERVFFLLLNPISESTGHS